MPHVIDSIELAQVLAEAQDIARSVNQSLTSAHQLLGFFTIPNRAELLLRDRGIDEDRILAAMTEKPKEPDGIERELRERAREVAVGVGAEEVDCLHLLIAMSRVRSSAAHQLLAACGLQLATLRNVALSYFTSRMPRRLRELAPQSVKALRPTPMTARTSPPAASPPAMTPDAHSRIPTPPPVARPAAALPGATPVPFSRPVSPYSLDAEAFPWLSSMGPNLTELAASHRLDPLVGREREVEEAIDILGKRRTNNPLLVGEPGVGKTAIVEGIAQRLLVERGPEKLVVEIDMASVLAGTQLRGSFSEKLNGIKDEVRRDRKSTRLNSSHEW